MDWMFYGVLNAMYGIREGNMDAVREFMHHVFKFRSARKRQLRNSSEGIHDAMTEYIISGKLRIGKPPAKLGGKEIGVDEREAGYYMEDLAAGLTDKFDERLDQAKGRWYVV